MSIALQVSYDHQRGFDPGVTQNIVNYEIQVTYSTADDERPRCDSERQYLELHGRYKADTDRNVEFQRELQALLAKWQLVELRPWA
jgi:hypothetical protein